MCAPRKSLMVELKGCHLHKGPLYKVRTISPYCYYGHPSSFEVVTKRLGTLSFSLTFLSQHKSKQKKKPGGSYVQGSILKYRYDARSIEFWNISLMNIR